VGFGFGPVLLIGCGLAKTTPLIVFVVLASLAFGSLVVLASLVVALRVLVLVMFIFGEGIGFDASP
jgi:hypothetical protein